MINYLQQKYLQNQNQCLKITDRCILKKSYILIVKKSNQTKKNNTVKKKNIYWATEPLHPPPVQQWPVMQYW